MHTDVHLFERTESITKLRSKAIRNPDPKSNTETTERGKIVSLLSHILFSPFRLSISAL